MSDTSTEARLAALEGRVAELERQRWEGPPRLGPKPPTSDEMSDRLVDAVKDAIDKIEPPPVDRSKVCTTSGEPADKVRAEQTEATGQHKAYIVLCAEERAKGFVRPYRDAYRHVGRPGPDPANRLVDVEGQDGLQMEMAKNDPHAYLPAERVVKYWRREHLREVGKGCGAVTTMGRSLSETWARDPGFYQLTFCVSCNDHRPVAEFVWDGTNEVLGS